MHQFPAHAGFGKSALGRNVRQHAHEHIPDKRGGQRKFNIGGDTEGLRQFHLQPLRHAGTLHQHGFGGKRIAEGVMFYHRCRENLQNIELV